MFGGPKPKEFGWMDFTVGTDELRLSFRILIFVACVTNVAAALCTAVFVRRFRD
jgi:hypothetical protein